MGTKRSVTYRPHPCQAREGEESRRNLPRKGYNVLKKGGKEEKGKHTIRARWKATTNGSTPSQHMNF